MPTILAIDAAWTPRNPSGVALVTSAGDGWRCVAVAPSYAGFLALTLGEPVDWLGGTFRGSVPDFGALLPAATELAGAFVDVITVDMPVSTIPFSSRRAADDAVSRAFGSRWCAAHTPNAERPGAFGESWTANATASGFELRTAAAVPSGHRSLLEVYPHPALLSLLQRPRRVPYKVDKRRKYWPGATNDQRKQNLLAEFNCIRDALTRTFGPLSIPLPTVAQVRSFAMLKRFEDALDALICAWVGVRFLAGTATALGDATAAIWCPTDALLPHGARAV
jgi:predicted RNase H-like nuclease